MFKTSLIKFHQSQVNQKDQLAEILINNASHMSTLQMYQTTQQFESTIDDLLCEASLLDRKLRNRPHPRRKRPQLSINLKLSGPPVPQGIPEIHITSPTDENNPKNRHSSKGKDIAKHPWRPVKLKKNKTS